MHRVMHVEVEDETRVMKQNEKINRLFCSMSNLCHVNYRKNVVKSGTPVQSEVPGKTRPEPGKYNDVVTP